MKLPKITCHLDEPILVLTILAPFLGSRSAQPASYSLHTPLWILKIEYLWFVEVLELKYFQ